MKIITLLAAAAAVSLPAAMKAEEPQNKDAAVIMVHFGTTHDDTRAATIDAINRRVADSLQTEAAVTEAYSSRIVRRRLAARGINKPTPREALLRLAADGYSKVTLQPTYLLNGVEFESLCNEAAEFKPFFTEITVGQPLLASTDDSQTVVDILAARHADKATGRNHVVFVGHGTPSGANAIYSQLDYMLAAGGNGNMHVATIEGYPTFETMLPKLKGAQRVTLVPLLFVAGDHASNDIAVEWREALEKEGYKVDVVLEGLGEIPEIHQIYLDHLRQAANNAVQSASDIKNQAIAEAE